MGLFSVVQRHNGVETGRSRGLTMEQALAEMKKYNRSVQDTTDWANRNCYYVEETGKVRYLPVNVEVGR